MRRKPLVAPARTSEGEEPGAFHFGGEDFIVVSVPVDAPAAETTFTDAERNVADLAAAGLANEEIARLRNTSRRTIANQLATVFRKAGVGSRVELAAYLAKLPKRSEPET
jgi:DNA-binding CsgD family transcriptional regulator